MEAKDAPNEQLNDSAKAAERKCLERACSKYDSTDGNGAEDGGQVHQ
jgi:hypothetical protein